MLQAGTVVATRFQVEAFLGSGGLGQLYRAVDLESQKPVALRTLAPDICQDEPLLDRLRAQVKTASALQHKNITSVFGMGKEGNLRFVAMEFVDGRSLRHLIDKKRASNKTFSLKGAYNVLAHICNALTEAHRTLVHGLLGPGAVLINQVGRIKVCEFGVVQALPPGSHAVARMGDRYCIAPEMEISPSSANASADIYSLGIILFELLTGQTPPSQHTPPSSLLPYLQAVDPVVARCLDPDPTQRFQEAREVKAAFYSAMQQAEQASSISGPVAAIPEPQQPRAPAPAPAAPMPMPPPGQVPPQARAPQAPAAPAVARPVARDPVAPPPQQQAPAKPVDIQALLADAGGDTTEKWLIQKDRLDFGPFAMGDLKQQLYKQEFSGDDVVVDQETGERSRIRNHPMFRDFIVQLERHLESKRADAAELQRMHQDKRRRTILIVIVLISLAVLGAGGAITAYYMTREPETRERIVYRERDNLGKLLKGIDITWKAEPTEQANHRRRLLKRKRVRRPGAKAGSDDVTHLGDATQEGGDALLSQKAVQGVMAQSFGKLKGCVVQEARRNPSMRQVVIEFGIRGTGSVSSVKVNGKSSGPFHSCLFARMQTIKFPTFDGQITRAVFSMNLQY
jgi:hypothetical protein